MKKDYTKKEAEDVKRKLEGVGLNDKTEGERRRLFGKKSKRMTNTEFELVKECLKYENKLINDIDNNLIKRYNKYFSEESVQNKIQMNSFIKHNNQILKVEEDPKPLKINESQVMKIENRLKKKEEIDGDNKILDNGKRMNWMIESFIPITKTVEFDDFDQILLKSDKYLNLVKYLRQKNIKFEDKKFPPNLKSLMGFYDDEVSVKKKFERIEWKRPEEFLLDKKIIIYDKISPNDIRQGKLGDCYFLAAISSIATHPSRLERLFLIKNYNKEDIYAVAFCINGIWQEVIMDGYLPCENLRPAFNSNKSNALWVMLLEKAWAKIHGGYYNINSGLTREALRDLTGAPAKTLFLEDFQTNYLALWEKLIKYQQKRYIFTAGSDNLNNGNDAFVSKIGIAGSHAYSMLAIYELAFYKGSYMIIPFEKRQYYQGMTEKKDFIERIIKLRNPWGKGEWKGKWGDNDSVWNTELRKLMGHTLEEDGTFYIDFNYFIKYFSDIQICKYHDSNKYSSATFQSNPDRETILTFTLNKKGKHYFSLNQKNKRFFSPITGYNYSTVSMLIFHQTKSEGFKLVGTIIHSDKEMWFSSLAEEGSYFVYLKTPWQHFVNEFNFSVYGPSKTKIIKIEQLPKNFLNNIFINDVVYNKKEVKDLKNNVKLVKEDKHEGFGYLFFKNEDQTKYLNVVLDIFDHKNIRPCFPFQSLKPTILVPPNQSEIFVYEATQLPYMAQFKILYTQKSENEKLYKEIMTKGNKIVKNDNSNFSYHCYQYILNHKTGIYILTCNDSDKFIMNEMIYFKIANCLVDGYEDPFVEITLKPKRRRLIEIKPKNPQMAFDAEIYKVITKFFEATR